MAAAANTSFAGEIVVASRIVDALSSGLYESPAACLKELVNNAYDADATTVRMYVKPDADEIVVEDDGVGMNKEEFIRHFSRISESHKRDDTDQTPSGRPKVGKIGIGFIAANELCDVMEIESTKAGSTELLRAAINFAAMRAESPEARRVEETDSFRKGDYTGDVAEALPDEHYTHVFLRRVRGDARRILVSGDRQSLEGGESLYGLKPESIAARLAGGLKSWTDLDLYSQTLLGVALNVPVQYAEGWLPDPFRHELLDFAEAVKALDFDVVYDGAHMRKPTVFGSSERALLRRYDFQGEHLSARGYFYAQHGTLKPRELQGALLRIRNAAVGGYDSTFLGYPIGESQLFKNWISGEIWASDGLEDAMNIDRRTLRVTHPAYAELQQHFHTWFNGFLLDVRKELYAQGSSERKANAAEAEAQRVNQVVRSSGVSRPVAREVARSFPKPEAASDKKASKRLTKKYTVGDVYEAALEVARPFMSEDDFDAFVRELTRRLAG